MNINNNSIQSVTIQFANLHVVNDSITHVLETIAQGNSQAARHLIQDAAQHKPSWWQSPTCPLEELLEEKSDPINQDAFFSLCAEIVNVPSSEAPAFWTKEFQTKLFFSAANQVRVDQKELCLRLIGNIDVNATSFQNNYSLITVCAQQGWNDIVETLLQQKATLTTATCSMITHPTTSLLTYFERNYITFEKIASKDEITISLLNNREFFISYVHFLFIQNKSKEIGDLLNYFETTSWLFSNAPSWWNKNEPEPTALFIYALNYGYKGIANRLIQLINASVLRQLPFDAATMVWNNKWDIDTHEFALYSQYIRLQDLQLYFSFIEQLCTLKAISWWKNPQKKAQVFCSVIRTYNQFVDHIAKTVNPLIEKWFIDTIDVNYVDTSEGGDNRTPLMYVGNDTWKEFIIPLLKRKAKISARDKTGKYAFQYISPFFQNSMETLYDAVDVEDCYPWVFYLMKQDYPSHKPLLDKICALQEKPHWWHDPTKMATLCCKAALQNDLALCTQLIDLIDVDYFYRADPKIYYLTPLMAFAQQSWTALTLRCIERGANLFDRSEHGRFAFEYIINCCSNDLAAILSRVHIRESDPYELLLAYIKVKCPKARASLRCPDVRTFSAVEDDIQAKAAWWKDPKKRADYFCWAALKGCKPLCEQLIDMIDINYAVSEEYYLHHTSTPLTLVAEQSWSDLVIRCIQKGAKIAVKTKHGFFAFQFFLEHCKQDLEKIFNHVLVEQEDTYDLLLYLIKNDYSEAHILYTRPMRYVPAWLRDTKKMAVLFCCAAYQRNRALCTRLINIIDINYIDTGNIDATPLAYMAKNSWPDLVIRCINRGGKLFARTRDGSFAISYIFNYCKEQVEEIFNSIRIDTSDTYELLLYLIKNTHPEVAALLMRIISASNKPRWWNNRTTTELFFETVKTLPHVATQLLAFVDVDACDVYNKKRTPLMLACFYQLGRDAVHLLLENGSNLACKDSEQSSALEYVLRSNTVAATDTIVRTFLVRCGLSRSTLENVLSHRELLELLHPLSASTNKLPVDTTAGVIMRVLFNDTEEVKKYFSSLSPMQRLSYIELCNMITYNALSDELLNLAFQIDFTHFMFQQGSFRVEAKDVSMDVPKTLLMLFNTYCKQKNSNSVQAIEKFANYIKNRTQFLGTPSKMNGLDDFYTHIENCVGATLKKLNQEIEAFGGDESFQKLLQAHHFGAIDLFEKINGVLKEYIEAADFCGGRFLTTAATQYGYVVKDKAVDLQSKFYSLAAEQRGQIAESLFYANPQSIHAYTLFVRNYGEKYDLPDREVLRNFDDIFSSAHREEVANAERNNLFLKRYTPTLIAKYFRDYLKTNGQDRDATTTFLNNLVTKKRSVAGVKDQIVKVSVSSDPRDKKALCELIKQTYDLRPEEADLRSAKNIVGYIDFLDRFFQDMKQYAAAFQSTQVAKLMAEIKRICPSNNELTRSKKEEIAEKLVQAPLYMVVDIEEISSLEAVKELLMQNNQLYMALSRENENLFSLEAMMIILIALRIVK